MPFFVHSPLIHDIIYKNIGMRSMGGLKWDTLCTECFHFCNRKMVRDKT